MKGVLLLLGRLLLAGIFLYAGYSKLREPWVNFAGSIYTYKLVPDDMLEPMARTIPWFEVTLGIAVLSGIWLRWSALTASLVLVFFLSVLTWEYAHGVNVDCGCFGSGEPLGPKTLMRDSTMLILALAVTVGAFRTRAQGRRFV